MRILLFALCVLVGSTVPGWTQESGRATAEDSRLQEIPAALALYRKLIGATVLLDPNVNGYFDLKFTPDMNDARKAELIEKQVFLNGFSMFDSGKNT